MHQRSSSPSHPHPPFAPIDGAGRPGQSDLRHLRQRQVAAIEPSIVMEKANDSLADEVPVPAVPAMKPLRSRSKFFTSTARREIHGGALHRTTELPPTLQGFFYGDGTRDDGGIIHYLLEHHHLPCKNYGRFASLPGLTTTATAVSIDPSLSFLRNSLRPWNSHLFLLDSSNGLLLLGHMPEIHTWPDFVVCNPATEQWVRVPGCVDWVDDDDDRHDPRGFASQTHVSLLFDPAASSHFQVLIFWRWRAGGHLLEEEEGATATTTVHAYSSETGEWRNSESHWSKEERRASWELWRRRHQTTTSSMVDRLPGAFVDGMLYLSLAWCKRILQVDMDGKTRGMFPAPAGDKVLFVGRSQGRLHCVVEKGRRRHRKSQWRSHEMSIWVLDGDVVDSTQEWVLKHKVSSGQLFGNRVVRNCEGLLDYRVVAMHPDCDMVFFHMQRWNERPMISYDFSRQQVRVVETYKHCPSDKIIPFVPYLSELFVGVLGGHR